MNMGKEDPKLNVRLNLYVILITYLLRLRHCKSRYHTNNTIIESSNRLLKCRILKLHLQDLSPLFSCLEDDLRDLPRPLSPLWMTRRVSVMRRLYQQ